MRHSIAAIAVLMAATPSAPAAAQFVDELRGGVLAQSCCGGGSTKEEGVSINLEALFDSPRFLSVVGAPRPLVGASIAADGDATNQLYGGLEWKLDFADRFFAAAAVGATVHDGETNAFDPVADADRVMDTVFYGCRVLFRIGGDLGYRLTDRVSASVHWNHISNAGLCSDNEGLDHLGLRVGYRF